MNDNVNKAGEILTPELFFSGTLLTGQGIKTVSRKIADLDGIFQDEKAYKRLSSDRIIYEVTICSPLHEKTSYGLYFGITKLFPGKVGNEYFMTKGHFHENSESAEYYWCLEGEGMLILMDRQRHTWAEKMFPGSLHYIPGNIAHRIANIGSEILCCAACWPTDAGHDYKTIEKEGFSARLFEINNVSKLI